MIGISRFKRKRTAATSALTKNREERLPPFPRQIAVLQSKLCLESHITMGGRRLAIHNPELIVSKLRPYFHSAVRQSIVQIRT